MIVASGDLESIVWRGRRIHVFCRAVRALPEHPKILGEYQKQLAVRREADNKAARENYERIKRKIARGEFTRQPWVAQTP